MLIASGAISHQSFWIDEAGSGVHAVAKTAAEFRHSLFADKGSTLQMPLYMVLLWDWEKLAGSSEYALRALNLPLFALALLAIQFLLKRPAAERTAFIVFAALSPMLWAYLDEARPYVMEFAGAALIVVALLNLASEEGPPGTLEAALAAIGAIVLCGASLTGVIFTAFFGAAFLVLWGRRESPWRSLRRWDCLLILLCAGLFLGSLAIYYCWTLKVGARATSAGKTTAATIAFCFYELVGAAGLGPGRNALRADGLGALKPYLSVLAAFFVVSAGFGFFALRSLLFQRHSKRHFIVLLAAAASLCAMIFVGIAMDFRVLGRHLIPILPVFLWCLAVLFAALWERGGIMNRSVGIIYLLVLGASCLSLRIDQRFAKDDYRDAAAVARQALGQREIVWWAADPAAAIFYGLRRDEEGSARLIDVRNRTAESLATLPKPDLVVLSKADLYDDKGRIAEFVRSNQFILTGTPPAMALWVRSEKKP